MNLQVINYLDSKNEGRVAGLRSEARVHLFICCLFLHFLYVYMAINHLDERGLRIRIYI